MRILIVGAGIAGLASAIAFKRLGYSVKIIEKYPSIRSEGGGIALPMNAVIALNYLGIKEALIENSYQVRKIIYSLPNGNILSEASLLEPPLNCAPFVSIRRNKLVEILLTSNNLHVEFGVEVCEIVERGDSVNVKFKNGSEEQFDLVIASDGVNSSIRKMLIDTDNAQDLGIQTWRFILKYNVKEPIYYFGKSSAFMFYPLNDNESYCYAHYFDPDKKISRNFTKNDLTTIFVDYCDAVRNAIFQIDDKDIISGRLISIIDPLLIKGKVAFVGDAAHACSPMLQQGAAKAFEDAIALSTMLVNFKSVEIALKNYEKFRLNQVKWITNNSDVPIKMLAESQTDIQYNYIIEKIVKDGPTNVLKWNQLFQINFISALNQYISISMKRNNISVGVETRISENQDEKASLRLA